MAVSALIIILPNLPCVAQTPARHGTPVGDPSLTPLFTNDSIPEYRWRAYGDIDKDGLEDIVVSEGLSQASQNGVRLFVYFGDSTGHYLFYDSTFGSPADLCFERDYRGIRMWGYWHMSASEGSIGYSVLTDSGFAGGYSMRIYGGDGGTQMGRDLYDAVFDNCDVEFRVERYRIVNGVVDLSKD